MNREKIATDIQNVIIIKERIVVKAGRERVIFSNPLSSCLGLQFFLLNNNRSADIKLWVFK
ncbi:MAG: hypothetical protein GX312_05035 [Candidatus Phytoplasma sp.]|nr:hypothetical protein [Phytoplasma sp.]